MVAVEKQDEQALLPSSKNGFNLELYIIVSDYWKAYSKLESKLPKFGVRKEIFSRRIFCGIYLEVKLNETLFIQGSPFNFNAGLHRGPVSKINYSQVHAPR